ncbi:MAG: hypothetical protein P0Y56_07375 [Candidatus Andeanibacterium colombiense]|uniref:Uncharacterized protein n=1 Tax=Candidatus Andeanibacterium colombiense TaxID=3121345 RepID=A0AAJ5XB03_9SPHN|nr:MAG: hypothetical protein P0Y56_07375 [Sphingomonadaceae bacterium]
MRKALLILFALAQLGEAPALAADAPTMVAVKDRPVVQLDPAKAYVLVQTAAALPITLFARPSEEERANDRQERAAALEKQHARWVKNHASWARTMQALKDHPEADKPKEPVEPTEDSFAWAALETKKMIMIGPLNRFSKGEKAALYLTEVPPGEYIFYGTISAGLGTCACMGTVWFDVVPGKVTTLRYDYGFADKDGRPLDTDGGFPEGVDRNDALVRALMILSPADGGAKDPRIPADMFAAADFHAMPTLPNWFGAEINRLQPIPGVLAYRRDKVIDLKAPAQTPEAAPGS